MNVEELTIEQKRELKERFLLEKREEAGEPVFGSELVNIDKIVTDEEITETYKYITFVNDDFFVRQGA